MRIVIGEDSILIMEALAALLESAGHRVVAKAATGPDAVIQVDAHVPDLVIMDVRMPAGDEGIRAAREIRGRRPRMPIMLLSQYVESRGAAELLKEPGTGYLLKDRVLDVAGFLTSLERVASGGTALDPGVVQVLLRDASRTRPLDKLSEREHEVLGLMAEGHSNTSIATRLVISDRTVESHISSIFMKLGIDNDPVAHRRVQAVLAHLRGGSPTF